MSAERTAALLGAWREVNRLADVEDTRAIRALIAEAGVESGVHVGRPPEDFDDLAVRAEYVLGQWASMIDHDSAFLNSCRNVSQVWYERHVGNGAVAS